MKNLNKKILEQSCKSNLLDIVADNKYLKENVTFKQHIKVCKKVTDLTYTESISFVFNNGVILDEFGIRDFESRFSTYLKYGLAAIAGGKVKGVMGLSVAVMVTYLFRKSTDPCWQSCLSKFGNSTERSICKAECHVAGAKSVLLDVRSAVAKCNNQPDPEKCEKTLRSHLIKWTQKVQSETIKLRLAKAKADQKVSKNRDKERVA